MPVLAEETSVFPHDLMTALPEGDVDLRQWWVLYTRSRQEKSLARRLLHGEIPFFLPLLRLKLNSNGRRICSLVPMFRGYVFLYGTEEERRKSLTTNHVSRVLNVTDGERLWHDLRQISRLMESGLPLAAEPRLATGTRVRVTSGGLEGLTGRVLGCRGETRLLIGVDFLQRGASVEIDEGLLEPLD